MEGLGEFIATLTPTPGEDTISTMTPLPTIIYPTLTPTEIVVTPTEESIQVFCRDESVAIECKATVCVVRKNPASGDENRAYNVPNGTIIENVQVCECPSCSEFEREWFFLGKSGDQYHWALSMNQVWEQIDQGE